MLPVNRYASGAYNRAIILAVVLIAVTTALSSRPIAQGEDPKEIIAAHVRTQGNQCDKPLSAERNRAASEPHETVWTLRCDNASYRVRLVPDLQAEVTKIDCLQTG
jgi:hypothetical protein